ncbi:MAG: beta-galactosidase [Chloroflexota bacterium]|nr:beta-galactosidase [Chloroflexota bacterium]MCY3581828.1 beta-galactosidase [Chloroflexota bacterium]MDE2650752.1 beta-galactosidase [Chloroflexota bacterium]MXV93974.1 beta-galactosidase [Chloroflexota bacterium]MXX51293.1 beta-galactosidase [Chloroflexota bacterium]
MTNIPRPEYPRPQFMRHDWLCLNGEWQFEIDAGDSGWERGLLHRELRERITVPFCPESVLSGIENPDFMRAVWYRRSLRIPAEWAGRRILLHFQAVDYDSTVWVNGAEVGRHRGGFSSFCCDLSGVAAAGDDITIVLRARDDATSPQPRGKQTRDYDPSGAVYVRTTGIWQSVWLEPVPEISLRRTRITPDLANATIRLEQPISGNAPGLRLRASLSDAAGLVATADCSAAYDLAPRLDLTIPAERLRPWSISDPHLYDLQIELLDSAGEIIDSARSYAGLRAIAIVGKAIQINGETVFQRLVLDQGYYPDGIMTAPSDDALRQDIELSMAAGFNGARLHQKVFEERFLYHADRLGYIVWGEFGDWGCSGNGPIHAEHQQPGPDYITQWLECLERDYSHPCIVGWCPLNETWQTLTDRITALDDVTRGMYLATKAFDSTRPVLDTSGYSHRVPEADVYDSHDYTQDPATFRERHSGLASGDPYLNDASQWGIPARMVGNTGWSIAYRGQPYFVSEFGGIWWNPDVQAGEDSWGYGTRPRDIEEFYQRFEQLCAILLDDVNMFGYCYTQLTDIYQEQNGIYKFDRGQKFDLARIRAAQTRPAAIELRGK